jgi:RNA polymerase sigma-70 factor (ECF subfamily)
MDDEKQIKLIREGHGEVFEDLLIKYQKQAHFLAFRYLKDWDEADDIVQRAFIKLYKFIIKSKDEIAVLPWIRKVIVNLCLDQQKSKKWRIFFKNAIKSGKSNPDDEKSIDPFDTIKDTRLSPEHAFLNEELRSHMDRLVDKLPYQQKTIFFMKHFEGLKIKDIAQQLKISEGQIKSQLFRAVRNLRRGLGEFYET